MQSSTNGTSQLHGTDGTSMADQPALFPSDAHLASLVDENQKAHNHQLLFADDIGSMLPWRSMTTAALCEFITAMASHMPDHILIAPFLLSEWAEDTGTDCSTLYDIADHFQPASHGGQKTVYIVSPFDQVVKAIAVCSITHLGCYTVLIGTPEDRECLQSLLVDLFSHLREAMPALGPDFFLEDFLHYCILASPKATGRWACGGHSEVGLVLAGAFLDCLYQGVGFLSFEGERAPILPYNTGQISRICLSKFVPFPQHFPEDEDEDEGNDNDEEVIPEARPGYQGYGDPSPYPEPPESLLAHMSSNPYLPGAAGEFNGPGINNAPLPYFHLDNNNEAYDDDDDDDDEEDDDEEDDDENLFDMGGGEWSLNIQAILNKMADINMEDDEYIKRQIVEVLKPKEREKMTATEDIEREIYSNLPSNAGALMIMRDNEAVNQQVATHRNRIRVLVDALAQFMLAVGKREELPESMRGWFVFVVANASRESRERLVRLLTHPSVHALFLQYPLGATQWYPDMFDQNPRTALRNFEEMGDFFTAYIAVGHRSETEHFLYSGSATSMSKTSPLIGEAKRMQDHQTVLAKGVDDVLHRRQQATKSPSVLLFHQLMVLSGEYFFFPCMRYPANVLQESHKMSGALALFAENINMMYLSSRSSDHVPRGKWVSPIARVSQAIVDGLTKDANLPRAPWKGANVVLPLTQTPTAIWRLVQDGCDVVPTPELIKQLRDVFASGQETTLASKTCREILLRNGRGGSRGNISMLRKMYAAILRENDLVYLSQHQSYLLRYSILFVAIIGQGEKWGLVSGPLDDRYYLEASALDWISVSRAAQAVASPELRSRFTAEGCLELFYSPRGAYFVQQMFLRWNWDRLRQGLPQNFASHRAVLRHPPLIKSRIQRICRYEVLNYMTIFRYIEETPTGIQVKAETPVTTAFLCARVIDQLKKDISLCPSVEIADGAWDDEAMRQNLAMELRRAFKKLSAGLPASEAMTWRELDVLDPDWADPQDNSEPTTAYSDMPQKPDGHDDEPLAAYDDTDGYLQLLRASHVKTTEVFQANERSAFFGTQAGPAATPGPSNASDGNDGPEPFELCGSDGRPARTKLFGLRSNRQQRPRGPTGTDRQGEDSRPEPQSSGVCKKCLVFWSDLSAHVPHCRGRCQTCRVAKKACIRDPRQHKCVRCQKGNKECEGFSHEEEPDQPHTTKCPKCWRELSISSLRGHLLTCRGRCEPCQLAEKACVQKTNNEACVRCKEKDIQHECLGFSHEHEHELKPKKKCERCGNPKNNVTVHERGCIGKCRECQVQKIACEGTGARGSRQGGCKYCKEKGKTCGDFSHQADVDAGKKKKCPRCDVDGLDLKRHRYKCPGKCPGCAEAGEPCVRDQGVNKPCKRCRESTPPLECGKGVQADAVETKPCRKCGKEYYNHTVGPHQKNCKGKCSACELRGTACERAATSYLGPCGACKTFKTACDGAWRKKEQGETEDPDAAPGEQGGGPAPSENDGAPGPSENGG